MPETLSTAALEPSFNAGSWVVIILYLIVSTWLGHRLSRRQQTFRDFFLGGRRLPWPAVCGSIIATELSAMTLVGVPAMLWAATGDMGYAVLAIGTIIARILVGFFILPQYYREENYSPYEYIGRRLGKRAERLTSLLFMIGGILGQGTRVLLTAIVLQVVTGMPIHASIWLVGAAAILWTFMGGIVTVIWTDVIQFAVFTFSAIITLLIIGFQFVGPDGATGFGAIFSLAAEAGKLQWLDTDFDLTKNYTLWAALIGATVQGLAAYGTDQMMMQRCFCCRSVADARKAMIWSNLSQVLMVLCLFMGAALWAYYKHNALPGVPSEVEMQLVNEDRNRLLPVFIHYRVHWLLGGLMVAGIFAAAISSLDSILAALSQQSVAWVDRWGGLEDRAKIRLSRMLIFFWAAVMCGMASLFYLMAEQGRLLIELALAVVGYVAGAILGTFLIAAIPRLRRPARGLEWCAALSMLTIVAITRHDDWTPWILGVVGAVLILTAELHLRRADRQASLKVLLFMIAILVLNGWRWTGPDGAEAALTVGWPYYTVIGTSVMLLASALIAPHPPAGSRAAS